jgi:hypothetical protein
VVTGIQVEAGGETASTSSKQKQMNICYLCKRTIGEPDVYIALPDQGPAPRRKGDDEDRNEDCSWEPAHQDCLDRAVELMEKL